jgi:hypothetical protein
MWQCYYVRVQFSRKLIVFLCRLRRALSGLPDFVCQYRQGL